jgi:cytochrome o ubiquinol oxidase subunit IV
MSDIKLKSQAAEPKEVGSMQSYTIGFMFSLILTFIPYYLVQNQIVSGTTLLVTILGFAVLQMAVQVLFFLHLGRGPKPFYNVVFFFFTIGTILVVVGGSVFIMAHLHYNMSPSEVSRNLAEGEGIYQIEGKSTGACRQTYANHKIAIATDSATPLHTSAHLCDTLTFISSDNNSHTISFGTYPKRDSYSGLFDLAIRKRVNKTITLNQLGTYEYHDAINPAISGNFTVTQ